MVLGRVRLPGPTKGLIKFPPGHAQARRGELAHLGHVAHEAHGIGRVKFQVCLRVPQERGAPLHM